MTVGVWIAAAVIYAVFLGWYVNWRGALTSAEIEKRLAEYEARVGDADINTEDFRAFLEADDGKQFIMLNQIKLHKGKIAHPDTGELMAPSKLLEGYTGYFMKALFRRGGHPVFVAPKVGGIIDSWNAGGDPEWGAVAMMRYRARRDLMILATDARFDFAHSFKLAAMEKTTSFPTQMRFSTFLSPKWSVLMALLGLASFAQNLIWIFY